MPWNVMAQEHELRFIRVGIQTGDGIVVEATLPPGSSVIVASAPTCTVQVPVELGLDRVELIRDGRTLVLIAGTRVNMMDDAVLTHVCGEVDDLLAGFRSECELRWHKLNIRLRPGLNVLMQFVEADKAGDRRSAAAGPRKP